MFYESTLRYKAISAYPVRADVFVSVRIVIELQFTLKVLSVK